MATVIYGQPDQRFEQVGKALGQLGGNIYQGYETQKAAQGVAAIMQDPNVSDADKGVKALKDFGPIGYQLYNQQVATQAKQAQITGELARAKLEDVQAQRGAAGLPYVAPQAAAQVGATQAETGLRGAETARTQALTQATTIMTPLEAQAKSLQNTLAEQTQSARIAATVAEAGTAETQEAVGKIQLKRLQDTMQSLQDNTGILGPQSLNAALDSAGIKDEGARNALKMTYQSNAFDLKDPNAGVKAFTKGVETYTQQRTAATARAGGMQPPKDIGKVQADAGYATALGDFVQTMKESPEEVGLTGGIRAQLSRIGLDNDPQLVRLNENQALMRADQAMKSGQFLSSTSTKIASDITPSVNRTPIPNMIQANAVARQKIAEYNVALSGIAENSLINPKPYKDQLQHWQEIEKETEYKQLAFDDPKTGQVQRVHILGGNEVDPKTLKPLVNAGQKYGNVTGEQLINSARFAAENAGKPNPNKPGSVYQAFDPYQFLVSNKLIAAPAGQ